MLFKIVYTAVFSVIVNIHAVPFLFNQNLYFEFSESANSPTGLGLTFSQLRYKVQQTLQSSRSRLYPGAVGFTLRVQKCSF